MTAVEAAAILPAVCLVTAGMLFFMTLLYIAANPVEGEIREPGWWKPRYPKQPDVICPLHRGPRSQCRPGSHDDQP